MSEVEEELKARIEEITKASESKLEEITKASELKLEEAEQTFQATEAKLKQEAVDAAANAEEKFASLLAIQQGAYAAPECFGSE